MGRSCDRGPLTFAFTHNTHDLKLHRTVAVNPANWAAGAKIVACHGLVDHSNPRRSFGIAGVEITPVHKPHADCLEIAWINEILVNAHVLTRAGRISGHINTAGCHAAAGDAGSGNASRLHSGHGAHTLDNLSV